MKKRILIFCTVFITLGLTAFSVVKWEDSETIEAELFVNRDVPMVSQNMEQVDRKIFTDFIYDIGPRFGGIKKEKLASITSIADFYDAKELREIEAIQYVHIIVIKNEAQSDIREIGFDKEFTKEQLALLQSFDYSTNFSVKTDFEKTNKATGKIESSSFNPHVTIVPEIQAEYANGIEELKTYLRENSKEALINVAADKLRPAKLYFTVNKLGNVENVSLDNHSGYPDLDKKMIELISNLPGNWESAKNAKGERVNQELVVSFGLRGC